MTSSNLWLKQSIVKFNENFLLANDNIYFIVMAEVVNGKRSSTRLMSLDEEYFEINKIRLLVQNFDFRRIVWCLAKCEYTVYRLLREN